MVNFWKVKFFFLLDLQESSKSGSAKKRVFVSHTKNFKVFLGSPFLGRSLKIWVRGLIGHLVFFLLKIGMGAVCIVNGLSN